MIRKAGFAFTPPKLDVVLGKSPSSPCHFYDGPAYYCGDTIYLDAKADLDGYRDDPEWSRAWMAVIIGHEYGHHVQALTGILAAKHERGLTLNGIELHQEESRRLELQASCFGGAYLGADRTSFPARGRKNRPVARGRRAHGRPEARPRQRRGSRALERCGS